MQPSPLPPRAVPTLALESVQPIDCCIDCCIIFSRANSTYAPGLAALKPWLAQGHVLVLGDLLQTPPALLHESATGIASHHVWMEGGHDSRDAIRCSLTVAPQEKGSKERGEKREGEK